jgi:hypothetical protein
MTGFDPDAEGDGRYLVAFVESARTVSPVFGQRVVALAEQYFDDLSTDEWYRLGDMRALYEELHEQVGDETIRRGGEENAKAIPWPDGVSTVADGLAVLNEMHQEATRGSDEPYPAGRYTIDLRGDREVRLGVTEAFPWPAPFVEGGARGIVDDLGPADASPTLERISPEPHERAAWLLTW